MHNAPQNLDLAILFLRGNDIEYCRIFIHLDSGNHAVRLYSVNADKIIYMEPGIGKFDEMNWLTFNQRYYALIQF